MAMARRHDLTAAFLLGLALVSCVAGGASHGHRKGIVPRRGLVNTGATVFDVTKYDAKADDKTDNALPFIRAWNAACHFNGEARLVIPPGTFLTGPVTFLGPCSTTGPIVIEVQGIVKAQTDLSLYPSNQWFWIQNVNGFILEGKGTFDGQGGVAAWSANDCRGSKGCKLPPYSIKFTRVNNSFVRDINSINSMSFHFFIDYCQNLTVQNLKITAPGDSPNTDGIHVSSSNLVKVIGNTIGTGDDCVSIGQGSSNIEVSKIICGPGHGISVGSLGKYPEEKPVSGVVVTNCTLSNTTNGVRIKTWPGKISSQASNIIFEDIIMDMVKNPIIVDQYYGKRNGEASSVKISDVHFRKIRGTSTSNIAVSLQCSSLFPCEGVELVDIDFAYTGKSVKNAALTSSCLNAKIAPKGKMNPPACQ